MEPAVVTVFVAAWGHIPQLVINVAQLTPAFPPGQDKPASVEVALSDADALHLLKAYRLPHTDLCRWTV